jgi:hypothetical protein
MDFEDGQLAQDSWKSFDYSFEFSPNHIFEFEFEYFQIQTHSNKNQIKFINSKSHTYHILKLYFYIGLIYKEFEMRG